MLPGSSKLDSFMPLPHPCMSPTSLTSVTELVHAIKGPGRAVKGDVTPTGGGVLQ